MPLFDARRENKAGRPVEHFCSGRSPSPMFVDFEVSVPFDELSNLRDVVFPGVHLVTTFHLRHVLCNNGVKVLPNGNAHRGSKFRNVTKDRSIYKGQDKNAKLNLPCCSICIKCMNISAPVVLLESICVGRMLTPAH